MEDEVNQIMKNVCYGQQTDPMLKGSARGITWTEFLVATSDVQHPDQDPFELNVETAYPDGIELDENLTIPEHVQERNYFLREVYDFLNI